MTAKMVMASAARPMAVRQCCRVRNSIAEISVPACATPTHQTKLMMSQPHVTGMVVAPDADAGGNQVNQHGRQHHRRAERRREEQNPPPQRRLAFGERR